MNELRSKPCLPCILWRLLPALAVVGLLAIYFGPFAAAMLHANALNLAASGLQSGGFSFASATFNGAAMTISGVAPDEATR
jgi:hypothetical protein